MPTDYAGDYILGIADYLVGFMYGTIRQHDLDPIFQLFDRNP
jgi:hypothetical protein